MEILGVNHPGNGGTGGGASHLDVLGGVAGRTLVSAQIGGPHSYGGLLFLSS